VAAGAATVSLAADDFTITVDGTDYDVVGDFTSADDLVAAINATGSGVSAYLDDDHELVLSSQVDFTVAASSAGAALGVAAADYAVADDTDFLTAVTVDTASNANDAIQRIDAALGSVSDLRGTLGAIQNRFESTINSLQSVSENLSASRSRILDTDFAAETAALTRAQILQQAGTAMVAQANSVPQNVLSLLR
jgi:flagellin